MTDRKNQWGTPQEAVLRGLNEKAAFAGLFVRDNDAPDGPRDRKGWKLPFVGGIRGEDPSVGFRTLAEIDRWIEAKKAEIDEFF
jgi:hypothetical protein